MGVIGTGIVRCIGGRITKPLISEGDFDHKIYVLDCVCDPSQVTTLTNLTTMTNATSAGVDVLPAGFADASAYYIGDSEPVYGATGGTVSFQRRFATIPSARDDFLSYNYNYLPLVTEILGSVWATRREGGVRTVSARYRRDFYLVGTGQTYVTPMDIPRIGRFYPTYIAGSSRLEADWIGVRNGVISNPGIAAFLALQDFPAEDSFVEKYEGGIYMRTTIYVPPASIEEEEE